MPQSINDLIQTSANWRQIIAQNNRRTVFVIGVFFLIYLSLGLLIDTYIQSTTYPEIPLLELCKALITFKLIPWATLIMLSIATVSLLITFVFHDRLMLLGTDYTEITRESANSPEATQLLNVVEEMQIAAGLRYMPRVFIIEANYMNAFASGYSERSAMVAITRGLIQKLNRNELQAVMAHELSHIRHLDIKLTLMASVLANLMLIILDIFFYHAYFSSRSDNRRNSLATVIIVLRYLLPLINIFLILYLSRTREYMADAGCVQLTRDNKPLASALLKINADNEANKESYSRAYTQTKHENLRRQAYLFDPVEAQLEKSSSLIDLFSTHPSLEKRLAALGFKNEK